MQSLADYLNGNDPQIDLGGNPTSEVDDDDVGPLDDRQSRNLSVQRPENGHPGNRQTAGDAKSPQSESQSTMPNPDFFHLDPDGSGDPLPVNPQPQLEVIVAPGDVEVGNRVDPGKALPRNAFDRRQGHDEVKISPADERYIDEQRIHGPPSYPKSDRDRRRRPAVHCTG